MQGLISFINLDKFFLWHKYLAYEYRTDLSLDLVIWILLPGTSRRLAPVIKCNAFLSFQSYIVKDISLTEIYRWLVTFGSVR